MSEPGPRALLDPRWHWLRSAVRSFYAGLDPDDEVLTVTLLVRTDEGLIMTALANEPSVPEFRRIMTDEDGAFQLAEAVLRTTVDLTPDVPDG